MLFAQSLLRAGIRSRTLSLAPLALFWLASPVFGEQEYVTRYDAFAGYAFWIARTSAFSRMASPCRRVFVQRPGIR
jgi:hypothetical protein